MVHARPPHDIVALTRQQDAAVGKFDTEATADENEKGGAFLAPHPLCSPVARWVDTPLDLDGVAVARIACGLEVPEQPAPVKCRIPACVAHVHAVVHAPGR